MERCERGGSLRVLCVCVIWFGSVERGGVMCLSGGDAFVCCGVRRVCVCVCVAFVVDFGAGRCSASAVGLVVKYLVAIEMPRVRFPDGALSYAHTPPTAPFLCRRCAASTHAAHILLPRWPRSYLRRTLRSP